MKRGEAGFSQMLSPGSGEASLLPGLHGCCLYHAQEHDTGMYHVASPTPGINVVILGASRMRLSPLSTAW